jgi:hypothetical protein
VRFKILQFSIGAEAALAFAKNQCRRLVLGGMDNFRHEWLLEGFRITARCTELYGEHVVRLWLDGGGTLDAAYALGSLSPALLLNRGTLTPNFGSGVTALGATDIYRAILEDAKVTRGAAYTWATGNFVTFDATLFNFLATHVVDTAVADVYTVPVPPSPRKLDYEASQAWYSVSGYAKTRGFLWLAADLDKVVNGYVATFQVNLVDGQVPDGDQAFDCPMAGGRFTVPVRVTFADGKIMQTDDSKANKGHWALALASSTVDKEGLVTLTYTQRFNGANAVLIDDSLALAVPDDVITSTPPSFFQQSDGAGGTQDVTVPSTAHVNTYTVTEYAITPAVSADPFLIGYIRHFVSDEFLSGVLVATGNGGFGHIPYTIALNSTRSETLTAVYSDFSTQPIADPVATISGSSSSPPWQPPVLVDLDIIGANVPRHSYTYPGGDEFDLRHMTFSERDPALGYEVTRFAASVEPSTYERIEIRTLNGTLLRSAYRAMAKALGGIAGLETYTVVTVDDSGAWVQSGTWTKLLHTFIPQAPFVLYDAMVSVNEHVFTFAKMSKASGIAADSTLAIVPPGWAVATAYYRLIEARTLPTESAGDYGNIIQALGDFTDEAANPTRWLKDANGNLLPELQDAMNRIDAIITVCQFLEGAVVDPDEDGKNAPKYIDAVMDFFKAYADANADPDFAGWASDLRAEYFTAKNPRVTPLTAGEFAHLFTGYLSAHMRIVVNPFNVPYSTILCLGAGSWLWGTS